MTYNKGGDVLICDKCKPIMDRRKKDSINAKGIIKCQIPHCSNVTSILNFACASCSKCYKLCEICGYTIGSKRR